MNNDASPKPGFVLCETKPGMFANEVLARIATLEGGTTELFVDTDLIFESQGKEYLAVTDCGQIVGGGRKIVLPQHPTTNGSVYQNVPQVNMVDARRVTNKRAAQGVERA